MSTTGRRYAVYVCVFHVSGLHGSSTLLSRCSGQVNLKLSGQIRRLSALLLTDCCSSALKQVRSRLTCFCHITFITLICVAVFIFGTDFMGRGRCGWVRAESLQVEAEIFRYLLLLKSFTTCWCVGNSEQVELNCCLTHTRRRLKSTAPYSKQKVVVKSINCLTSLPSVKCHVCGRTVNMIQ